LAMTKMMTMIMVVIPAVHIQEEDLEV
jgi:hypothetical protein